MTMAGSAREAFSRGARARTDAAVVSGGNFVRAKLQDGRAQITSVLRTIVAQPPKMGNSAGDLALDIPDLLRQDCIFLIERGIFGASIEKLLPMARGRRFWVRI
jgi:hypothetical protein